MNEYSRLSALISSGEDDALATRALSKALGAEYETQEISKQGGGFREVQVTPPWCGTVWLGRADIAICVLDSLSNAWNLDKSGERFRVDIVTSVRYHKCVARAVWLAVVECLRGRAA